MRGAVAVFAPPPRPPTQAISLFDCGNSGKGRGTARVRLPPPPTLTKKKQDGREADGGLVGGGNNKGKKMSSCL